MEGFMSLADFSTVKANSAAPGELCLALRQMQTGEDTKGGKKGGGARRHYLTAIHLHVGGAPHPFNVLTKGRTLKVSKN